MTITLEQYQNALSILKSKDMLFEDDMIDGLLKINIKLFDQAMEALGYDKIKSMEIWNNEVEKAGNLSDVPKYYNNDYVDTRYHDPKKISKYALYNIIKRVEYCYQNKKNKQ